MDINNYVKRIKIGEEGLTVTLIDDSKHTALNGNPFSADTLRKYIQENLVKHNSKSYEGWLGGDYEKLGFYDTKKDAERGHMGGDYLTDLFHEFKEKKVTIDISVIDD